MFLRWVGNVWECKAKFMWFPSALPLGIKTLLMHPQNLWDKFWGPNHFQINFFFIENIPLRYRDKIMSFCISYGYLKGQYKSCQNSLNYLGTCHQIISNYKNWYNFIILFWRLQNSVFTYSIWLGNVDVMSL
jgi:hypothetical protein